MSQEYLSPRFRIAKRITQGETPYTVSLDEKRVNDFLASRGVEEMDLPNLKLRIRNKDFEEAAKTTYNDKSDVTVSVSAGYAWKQYIKAMKDSEAIIDGKHLFKNPYKKLLYTNRLPRYLKSAPKERGLQTAKRLLLNGISREINGSMLHELTHFADLQTGKHRFWYSTPGLIVSNILDTVRYFVDTSEREAANFERKNRNDPALRGILTISSKQ